MCFWVGKEEEGWNGLTGFITEEYLKIINFNFLIPFNFENVVKNDERLFSLF